jgi:hypothetical protein
MRLFEAEVDIMFISSMDNILYVHENIEKFFDEEGEFDGRLVKIVYIGQSSGNELSVFVAFDDAESFHLFMGSPGGQISGAADLRINYVINAVHKHLIVDTSPQILSGYEGYNTKYESTYKLFQQEPYGYFMANAMGTKSYKVNKNLKLITSQEKWDVDDILNW